MPAIVDENIDAPAFSYRCSKGAIDLRLVRYIDALHQQRRETGSLGIKTVNCTSHKMMRAPSRASRCAMPRRCRARRR